jgi:hypothetical protein
MCSLPRIRELTCFNRLQKHSGTRAHARHSFARLPHALIDASTMACRACQQSAWKRHKAACASDAQAQASQPDAAQATAAACALPESLLQRCLCSAFLALQPLASVPQAWTHMQKLRPAVLAHLLQTLAAAGLDPNALPAWQALAAAHVPEPPDDSDVASHEPSPAAQLEALQAQRGAAAAAAATGGAVATAAAVLLSSQPQGTGHGSVSLDSASKANTQGAPWYAICQAAAALRANAARLQRAWAQRNAFRFLSLACCSLSQADSEACHGELSAAVVAEGRAALRAVTYEGAEAVRLDAMAALNVRAAN